MHKNADHIVHAFPMTSQDHPCLVVGLEYILRKDEAVVTIESFQEIKDGPHTYSNFVLIDN